MILKCVIQIPVDHFFFLLFLSFILLLLLSLSPFYFFMFSLGQMMAKLQKISEEFNVAVVVFAMSIETLFSCNLCSNLIGKVET